MIRLVRPNEKMKDKAVDFKEEFFSHNEKTINGSELLDKIDDYDEWLKIVTQNMSPETVSPDWVVTDTFFCH